MFYNYTTINYTIMNYFIVIMVVIILCIISRVFSSYESKKIYKKIFIKNYDIQEIPNFLSNSECELIIELSKNKMIPSKLYNSDLERYDPNYRMSDQSWIYDNDNNVVDQISKRISDYTKTLGNHQEAFQIVKYNENGFFKPHHDACEGTYEYCKHMVEPYGNRLCTFLIYLNGRFH